jgi:hypothetical protein
MPWPNSVPFGSTWDPEPSPDPEPEEAHTQPPIAGAQDDDTARNLAAGLPADTKWGWFPTPEPDSGPNPQGAGWRP